MSQKFAPIPFKVLQYCGLWRSLSMSKKSTFTYNCFTVTTLFILVTIFLSVLIAVCQMPITDDLFAENVFLMFALLNATFKALNILLSRRKFLKMLDMVEENRWSNLRDEEEIKIQNGYSAIIRYWFLFIDFSSISNMMIIVDQEKFLLFFLPEK